jgi:hypothetical protein
LMPFFVKKIFFSKALKQQPMVSAVPNGGP